MKITDSVTPPLFMIFSLFPALNCNCRSFRLLAWWGVIYVVLRVAGKMFGAWAGAALMKAPETVRRWLGPTLVPQAGVAIGLSLVAESVVPQYASVIRAVVLCATLIYEIIGPMVTKICLKKAGEISADA